MNKEILEQFKENREKIINLFQTRFIGDSGFPVFSVDALTGQHIDKSTNLPELGDYLPFMKYYGQDEFVDSQVELVKEHFKKKKFIWNSHTRLPKHSWSFEYTDLILGLLLCYEMSRKKEYLELADDILNFVLKIFYKKGFICSHYFSAMGYTVPIASSICTMFSELLVDFYRLTNEKKYLDLGEELMRNMINSEGFRRYNLFPTYYPINKIMRFVLNPIHLTRQYDSSKYNCTASSSLMALYEFTKNTYYLNAYTSWFKGVNKYLRYKHGGYADRVIICRNNLKRRGLELINFHYLESFCDAYYFFKKKIFLQEAENLANFWLKKMGKTGLLPLKYNGKDSSLDAETDFVIGLGKLYELTGKEKYKDCAEKIIQGIFKFHKAPFGFVESVDIHTGKITNRTIETRFLSLFLKANIIFENNMKSYKNRQIFSILRDR